MNKTDFTPIMRLPAEWEPQGAIIIAWPHADTDWAYMLDEAQACFTSIIEAITAEQTAIVIAPDIDEARRHLVNARQDRLLLVQLPTNDTWARDFGPITLVTDNGYAVADFKFNGWGLKFAADKDNLLTRGMIDKGVLRCEYINRLNFVLEGGSIESDGKGTLLTTSRCLLSPNRNGEFSRSDIEEVLTAQFGLRKILWLEHGYLAGDDTDSHIDTLARLAPGDTILYTGCNNADDEHFEELQAMRQELMEFTTSEGNPYNLIELPLPDPVYDADGMRLPATYANFLIMNRTILMPSYRQPMNDELAAKIMRIAFPDHEVRMIDCVALIQQHGSLHCVTMQVPNDILPI